MMLEWHWFNWINVGFIFLNGYFAYEMFEDGNEFGGHLNMAAVAINTVTVANILTS